MVETHLNVDIIASVILAKEINSRRFLGLTDTKPPLPTPTNMGYRSLRT